MKEIDKGSWYPNVESFDKDFKKKAVYSQDDYKKNSYEEKDPNTLQKRINDTDLYK